MDDLDKLLDEMRENTADMIKAGEMAQALIDHQLEIARKVGGKDGLKHMARRALVLKKERPDECEALRDEYSHACVETVKKYVELGNILADVLTAFTRIPEDKKRFSSEMN